MSIAKLRTLQAVAHRGLGKDGRWHLPAVRSALDTNGTTLVSGDWNGVVRAGPLTGEEPHLLFDNTGRVSAVAVSPDGRWIASVSNGGTIRLWPMPDLSKPPLHTLPHDQLVAKLKSLTNGAYLVS